MTDSRLFTASNYAVNALHYEVALAPKPGLVDPCSSGAHQDMNVFTFINSITCLAPFFQRYSQAGFTHTGSLIQLFDQLRGIGQTAEEAMLQATKGINTHKGANFSFAILLGATGVYYQQHDKAVLTAEDTNQILRLAANICQHLVKQDLQQITHNDQLSYGEKNYLTYGTMGIRGEAAAGYPTVKKLLEYLRQQPQKTSVSLLRGLVYLMSETEDSNLVHRGGYEAMKTVQQEMQKIHQANLSDTDLLRELTIYDQVLIARHLSPGGSADLLALALYFLQLEGVSFW